MMANNMDSGCLLAWCGDSSKNAATPLSTKAVDKFVDFLWADAPYSRACRRKSAAIKISAVVSGAETAAYEIESASVRGSGARRAAAIRTVH
jgi:hypothetical protein